MAKPNFFIIGAPKAATTSLSFMLGNHPQVCIAQGKETHFFSDNEVFAKGMDWYESRFAHGRNRPAIGDASTSYSRVSDHPLTAQRIAHAVPHAKIIYCVRHPLDRIVSAYVEWMTAPKPRNFPSINLAVKANPSLIDASRYWRQITAYRAFFPDDRIKIVWFDEYTGDPDRVLSEVFAFLGVDASVRIPGASKPILTRASRIQAMRQMGNNTPVDTAWDKETRGWVIEQIADDIKQFLSWANKPADYWSL